MNPEIKARWVAALRSGEYRQGQDYLHTRSQGGAEQFCCLGVLCDLAAKDGTVGREDAGAYMVQYDETTTVLPAVVQEWAGLTDDNPDVLIGDNDTGHGSTLATENDTGATFDEIADLIEAQL